MISSMQDHFFILASSSTDNNSTLFLWFILILLALCFILHVRNILIKGNLHDIEKRMETLYRNMDDLNKVLKQKDALYRQLKNCDDETFVKISSLISEHETLQYKIFETYFKIGFKLPPQFNELKENARLIWILISEKLRNKEEKNVILQKNVNDLNKILKQKDALYRQLKNGDDKTLLKIASLISDHETLQYEMSENYLRTKSHPAFSEALRIDELKQKTRQVIQKSKIMEYKYEYLLQMFPDLEFYVDNIATIRELASFDGLNDFNENVDKTRFYLSKEEYETLSIDERNQLALNNYVNRSKTKWQIGRDYEMFVGYIYEKKGWKVEYFGIERQLEDMGRDLIAQKKGITHIVQCKYWSDSKTIHEKHIAQLYGTTIQYIISNNLTNTIVIPVFVTNIKLSETAKKFADYLEVEIMEHQQMEDFPRIKCNIGKDESGNTVKIYHLPMDQQYDRTRILEPGECFAFTVQEAVKKGFRRAKKYYGNQAKTT